MEQEHKVKSKKIEAAAILLTVALAGFYFYPRIATLQEKRQNAKVMSACKVFVDKTLERAQQEQSTIEKSKKKKNKPDLDKISTELMKEFGTEYCDAKTPLCCMVEYDKKTNAVVVTGFDSSQDVLMRTVISPPSFVTYER